MKRWLTLLLCVSLLAGLLSGCAGAESPDRAALQAGDAVLFGRFEQDGDEADGAEDIEWIVLDVQGDRALLLSRFALRQIGYHYKEYDTTWERCTLRGWLNGEFLNGAFTEAEREAIRETEVDNSRAQGSGDTEVDGGNNTVDRVFCLSYAEIAAYLPKPEQRICELTRSARSYDHQYYARWWERSPGTRANRALDVYVDGSYGGTGINVDASIYARPAIWVSTAALTPVALPLPSVAASTGTLADAMLLVAQARTLDEQLTLLHELSEVYAADIPETDWGVLNGVYPWTNGAELIPALEEAKQTELTPGMLQGRKLIALYSDRNDQLYFLTDFYARLPEAQRAASLQEADAVLYLRYSEEPRRDYIGSAYNRHYDIYLIDRGSGEVQELYSAFTTPPVSGRGALYGEKIELETLWQIVAGAL